MKIMTCTLHSVKEILYKIATSALMNYEAIKDSNFNPMLPTVNMLEMTS